MKRMLGAFTAAVLALTAGAALADEVSGQVQNIDATSKKFTVGDKRIQWSENSMGVKLDELKEGDKVTVRYTANQDGTNDAMDIMKEE